MDSSSNYKIKSKSDIYIDKNNSKNTKDLCMDNHHLEKRFNIIKNLQSFNNDNQNFKKNIPGGLYDINTQNKQKLTEEYPVFEKFEEFFLRKKRENKEANEINNLVKSPENDNNLKKNHNKIARLVITKIKSNSKNVNSKRNIYYYNENKILDDNNKKRNFIEKINSSHSIYSVNCPGINMNSFDKYGYGKKKNVNQNYESNFTISKSPISNNVYGN